MLKYLRDAAARRVPRTKRKEIRGRDGISRDIPDRRKRYMIDKKLISQAADEAERMLLDTPDGHSRRDGSLRLGWPDGMLTLGLTEAGRYDAVGRFLDRWIEDGATVGAVDAGLCGYAMLRLNEIRPEKRYRDAAEKIAGFLKSGWPRDPDGTMLYSNSDPSRRVYSDGTGTGTPFLARYGRDFDDAEFTGTADLQIKNWMKRGIDPATGLAHHVYSVSEGQKFNNIGWGRGTGWLMLAAGACAESHGDPETSRLSERFVTDIFRFRMKNGLFSWNLPDTDGPSDASATGMIMWGVMKMKGRGLLPAVTDGMIAETARACESFIREDGKVYGSSGECYDFGWYSDKFDEHNKWGQGAILAFLSMAERFLTENGKWKMEN